MELFCINIVYYEWYCVKVGALCAQMSAMKNEDGIRGLDLQALVDGETSSMDKASIMQRIHENPLSLQELESLMYQKMILKEWWKKTQLT